MTDPVFDKEGNLSNLDELTREEVAQAYQVKNREIFGYVSDAKKKAEDAEAAKAQLEKDLAEAKKVTPPANPPEVPKPQSPDIGELRLQINLSDEELEAANAIAKGTGTPLKEAVKHPLFVAFQEKRKAEQDKANAKLPANGGSSQAPVVEGIKPGTAFKDDKEAKAEHEKVFRKALGK